jgi:hypothetical protein
MKPWFCPQIKEVVLRYARVDLWDAFERFTLLKGLEQLGDMVYCPRKVRFVGFRPSVVNLWCDSSGFLLRVAVNLCCWIGLTATARQLPQACSGHLVA